MKDRYLFVVAHPDDELLGAGAMITKLIRKGYYVAVCVLSCKSNTRYDDIAAVMLETHNLLGISKTFTGNFETLRFKDEDHHSIVKFIENAIVETQPTVVITQHPTDLCNDHYITSLCCQEAVRLPQRQLGYSKAIKKFAFMEVPSETEFALNSAWGRFTPNYYFEVRHNDVLNKIKLLKMYEDIVRSRPHPRSKENIEALSIVRGSESGYKYAESFQIVFEFGGGSRR